MKANQISGPKKRNKSKVSSWSQIPENKWSHRTKRASLRGSPDWAYEHTGKERPRHGVYSSKQN
jgi:hypothetical protein